MGGSKGKVHVHHIIGTRNTSGMLYCSMVCMVRCENVLETRNKDGMSKLNFVKINLVTEVLYSVRYCFT